MRSLTLILSLSCCSAQVNAQRIYLVKHLYSTYRESGYTWMITGQPIGIRSTDVNLNFDDATRSCRLTGLSGDTLIVTHITSFKDTVVTWRKQDYQPLALFNLGWEYGSTLSRHRRLITVRYQAPLTSDTIAIPFAQINCIRSYRKSVQRLRDSGMELGALFPPVFAYIMFINSHPVRDYSLKRWKLMRRMPF